MDHSHNHINHELYLTDLDNILFHFRHCLTLWFHTVGVAARLCGLPVHGLLDGLLPTSKPKLALCEESFSDT